MNILHTPQSVRLAPAQRFVLHCVSWQEYEKFLEAIGENHVRVTYDRGSIELMSPLPIHERYKHCFNQFFTILALETGIPITGMGSTTFRREDEDRGIEPDECYYLQSASQVRDWKTLDLAVDPPPDLAIEIDITSSVLNRMEVYAALRIPELWRFDGEALEVYHLGADGAYDSVAKSIALPLLPLDKLVPLIERGASRSSDAAWLREIQSWLRANVPAQGPSNAPQSPLASDPGA